MASKAFLQAVAALKTSKNVETVLVGTNFLDAGTHDVSIKAVDTRKADEGKIKIFYTAEDGREFIDDMFLMSQDGTEFSYGTRALWSVTIPNKAALDVFLELVPVDDKAFEMFTGMKLRITLEASKGIQARALGDGTYAGFDVESNEKVTEAYAALKDVYDYVKANALKRSYLRIVKSEATAKEENLAAFFRAVDAKAAAAATTFEASEVG